MPVVAWICSEQKTAMERMVGGRDEGMCGVGNVPKPWALLARVMDDGCDGCAMDTKHGKRSQAMGTPGTCDG
eukprot:4850482-Alexandrium_andersonii.AAC.1